MFNLEESYSVTNSYLLKLKNVIEEQASFTWFKTKYVSKKRIDDLLCCIEGSFPEEYKNHIREFGDLSLSGYRTYKNMANCIRKKALLFPDNYSIDFAHVLHQIKAFQSGLKSDLKKLCETGSNMF